MDDYAALDAMIAKLKALGNGERVAEKVAQVAAPLIDKQVKSTAAAGQTPDGKAWQVKKDGGKPLVHATDHIETSAHGPLILQTLTGPDVFHHKGLGGRPKRQVIPSSHDVPQSVWKAVHEACERVWREILGR